LFDEELEELLELEDLLEVEELFELVLEDFVVVFAGADWTAAGFGAVTTGVETEVGAGSATGVLVVSVAVFADWLTVSSTGKVISSACDWTSGAEVVTRSIITFLSC
jgi:hypothetical protein